MTTIASIVWFRQDLRLTDNPALVAAIERGPVIPLYIWSREEEGNWSPGAASRWWLHQSLKSLDRDLEKIGSRLIIRRGPTWETLRAIIRQTAVKAVYWNRRYEPAAIERDKKIKSKLRDLSIAVESFNGSLLFEPWELTTRTGKPYQVFTPYWKACLALPEPSKPLPAPKKLKSSADWPCSLEFGELELEPTIDWAAGMRESWAVGERGALKQLDDFIARRITTYDTDRNRPDIVGSSRLSPHLHFGEISPRTIWHAVTSQQKAGILDEGSRIYLTEIGWREFAHHLLFHFPHTTDQPLREEFTRFPWRRDAKNLRAWQQGRTGYPIVDAGMRELWTTGWMHNRVRMIVASFLVKDLMIPWQEGAKWFWDTLVDADLANNTLGWQWTAGCGADAAPFFRVFNPVTQGEKFDPVGDYVRRWVPELGTLPSKWIHKPWEADASTLVQSGIRLGKDYPNPIVDHAVARKRALVAFELVKKS